MQQTTNNPFAAALNPEDPKQYTYGPITFDMWFVALIKGQGKVPFDATQHAPGQRRTSVSVNISPLPDTGQQWDIDREFIAEIRSDGWRQVTLPSLQALNITDLQGLNGKYVKAELVQYGTYQKREGGEGILSAPKIVKVFDTEDECRAAYEADQGIPSAPAAGSNAGPTNGNGGAALTDDTPPQPSQAPTTNGNGNSDALRKTALGFLPSIVRSCRNGNEINTDQLAQKLSETPLVKDYFTMDSAEVLAEVQKALEEPAF